MNGASSKRAGKIGLTAADFWRSGMADSGVFLSFRLAVPLKYDGTMNGVLFEKADTGTHRTRMSAGAFSAPAQARADFCSYPSVHPLSGLKIRTRKPLPPLTFRCAALFTLPAAHKEGAAALPAL